MISKHQTSVRNPVEGCALKVRIKRGNVWVDKD